MTLIEFYPALKAGSNGWEPDVDILERKEDFVISAELPGLSKKDISLTLEDDILTLKGEKVRELAEEDQNNNLSERRFGKFSSRFVMPHSIKLDEIETSFKDGLLRVSIPKSEAEKKKEIKVEFR